MHRRVLERLIERAKVRAHFAFVSDLVLPPELDDRQLAGRPFEPARSGRPDLAPFAPRTNGANGCLARIALVTLVTPGAGRPNFALRPDNRLAGIAFNRETGITFGAGRAFGTARTGDAFS